ncbi:MAG: NusG domain II-containing protein [Clostridia bacterium]|nr:NusG domain II-containing protein [Clostridia bacterium]
MKRHWILLVICAPVLVLSAALSIWALNAPGGNVAVIERDGEVLKRIDLAIDQEITIEYKDSCNVIEVSGGKIRVKEALCPDQTCVKMGWLKSGAFPIVCLPNHLVIEFERPDYADADAVSG